MATGSGGVRLVTICGCSGGDAGPQSIYKLFNDQKTLYTHLPYSTVPDKVEENAHNVVEVVNKQCDESRGNMGVILMGHSMGGAVAVMAAKILQQEDRRLVHGIVLINPQTEGLIHLQDIQVPLLTINAEKDEYFPLWQCESLYSRHKGLQHRLLIEGLGHDLERVGSSIQSVAHTQALFDVIVREMDDIFIHRRQRGKESKLVSIPGSGSTGTSRPTNRQCTIL